MSKKLNEFIDEDHKVAMDFYDTIDREHSLEEIFIFIIKDPDYFDPYFYLIDNLRNQDEEAVAEELETLAFSRVESIILDKSNEWPDKLEWGFHENRHIIRALMRKADYLWQNSKLDEALLLYKKLLHANLNDNIGARYAIVGIKLGLTYSQYMKQIWPNTTVPAQKIESWFKTHSQVAAEDLKEWKEYCINEIGLSEEEVV